MGAPENNKNAEIWDLSKSLDLYSRALDLAKKKTDYIVFGKALQGWEFDFIGELADELDIYSQLISRDLPERHEQCKTLWMRLKSKMESNCYSNTKKGIIKEAVGIVNLKANHGWKDRQDITSDDKSFSLNIHVSSEKSKNAIQKLSGHDGGI